MSLEIFWMQLFSGVSYTAILLLMSLGLAIVFGLMGVINMAHGELMALGAYVTFMVANVFLTVFPDSVDTYILFAIPIAFLVTFLFGMFLEWSVVRWFYNRPLDTLLATWGLSLILQQTYRTVFGPQEVTIPMASWLDGAIEPFTGVQLPLNRIFIIVLTLLVVGIVYLLFFKTSMGLKVRAITQNRAIAETVGINTRQVDMYTFALGSGLAGIAGSVFTMIGSTNPGTGQLYMFLKLEASSPELPDFMVWSSVEQLPLAWLPFQSFSFTLLCIFMLPVLVAFPFTYLIFKKRVSGVYFAILTLALSLTMTVLIIGSQGGTGGANGITDFSTLLGWDVASDEARSRLYYIMLGLLALCAALVQYLVSSRYGKVLIAIRDREDG